MYTIIETVQECQRLILSPLERIGRIAALVPPPRQHRHRYYGVLAPDSPMRPAVTALAPEAVAPASARGPPEWYEGSAEDSIDAEDGRPGDPLAQPEPEYEYDQRLTW